jgi:phospholipid transport system substrate-binding protein
MTTTTALRVPALVLALLLGAAAAWAQPEEPGALVRETSDRMLAVLKEQRDVIKAEPARLYGLVDEIVLPHFDFERMSRWVLGKHWRQASAEQQREFVNQFRTLLVRTYGTALLEYTDQQVKFLPVRISADGRDATVRTEVVKPGAPAIPINYSMYLGDHGWKVYDVVIDGISLVSNYRTTFAAEIRNHGIDALIRRLADRNATGGEV